MIASVATSSTFGQNSTTDVAWILCGLITFGIALWLAVRIISARQRSGFNSPRKLFLELCRAHKLAWKQRRMLRALAAHHQMPIAARLFLEPELFDVHTVRKARHIELLELRDRLFAMQLKVATAPVAAPKAK